MVLSSLAVHITKRSVRFISFKQTLQDISMNPWWTPPMACHMPGNVSGSLCTLQDGQSHVLPCSPSYFTPRTSTSILLVEQTDTAYSHFLKDMPSHQRMCKGSPSITQRQVELTKPVYDITHCDLHDSDVQLLFIPHKFEIRMAHSLEISNTLYWLCGLLIVVLVACLSQNLVALLQSTAPMPQPYICLVACIIAWCITLATGNANVYVTVEEQVAYWIMVAYGAIRILVSLFNLFYTLDNTYYNFLLISLLLLSSRIHCSMETPYVMGLLLLFAVRMFVKIFSSIEWEGNLWRLVGAHLVLLGDGVLLSVLWAAGVAPQFARQADADASTLAFLFAAMVLARGVVRYRKYWKNAAMPPKKTL